MAGVLEEAESGAGCVLDAPAWGAESEEDVVGDGLDDGALTFMNARLESIEPVLVSRTRLSRR